MIVNDILSHLLMLDATIGQSTLSWKFEDIWAHENASVVFFIIGIEKALSTEFEKFPNIGYPTIPYMTTIGSWNHFQVF